MEGLAERIIEDRTHMSFFYYFCYVTETDEGRDNNVADENPTTIKENDTDEKEDMTEIMEADDTKDPSVINDVEQVEQPTEEEENIATENETEDDGDQLPEGVRKMIRMYSLLGYTYSLNSHERWPDVPPVRSGAVYFR